MKSRLHGLEALRGLAAILVVYHHAGLIAGYPSLLSALFDQAYLAVDLFFLLSGFVLARTYEGRMPPALTFSKKRYVRLWPPICCGVILGAAFNLFAGIDGASWIGNLVTGLMIMPLIGSAILFNPPAWSIFFELIANLAHALGLHRISVRGLLSISLLCAVTLIARMDSDGLDIGFGESFLSGFPRVLMSYCLGIALYRINGDREYFSSKSAWPIIVLYGLLIASYPDFLFGKWEVLFALIVHPIVLLAVLSMRQSTFATLLGGASFPLYAIHFPLQLWALSLGMDWVGALLASIIGAALIGTLVDSRWRAQLVAIVPDFRRKAPDPLP